MSAIRSLALDGKLPLFYDPDINLLTFDGEAARRLKVPREFKDVLFRYFLGVRRLTALKQAQQQPQALFIEPWRKCNLACTYCYAESGPGYKTRVDKGKLLSLLRRYRFSRTLVFGGEPLLDPAFLMEVRKAQDWDSFFLSTNGLLLEAKATKELLAMPKVSLQLSLEPAEWNYRVTVTGEKQFDLVRRQLASLRDRNPNLRVTFPPDAPHISVEKFVGDLADAIGSWKFGISYWPARAVEPPPWLGKWMEETYELVRRDDGSKYKGKLPGYHMVDYFGEMEKSTSFFKFFNCNAALGAVAIGPDNKLHGCHENAVVEGKDDIISTDHNGQVIDETKRTALVDKWLAGMTDRVCGDCPARYLCGGICFILKPPNSVCAFHADMMPLSLAMLLRYKPDEVMGMVSRSEECFNRVFSRREELAKEVNCKKWNRLLSGALPLAEAVELAGRLLPG